MRVDAAPSANPLSRSDARSRAKEAISAIRRRWYLVVLLPVVGALLGALTAPDAPVEVLTTTRYFRASHVLIAEQGNSVVDDGSAPTVNLSRVAYLAGTGEVPARVAESLGIGVDEVRSAVIGFPRQEVSSVEIQAIATDAERATAMADAVATELLAEVEREVRADYEERRDTLVRRLDELDQQITALNDQIALDPPDRSQLEAQQRSVTNQYSLVYEQFSQFANDPEPTSGLTSLEGATVTQITEDEYGRDRTTIREGADYVTGNTQTADDEDEVRSEGPDDPAGPVTRAIVGVIGGLALALGLVFALDRFDSRLRRRSDIEATTGLSVVAEIPSLSRKRQRSFDVVADSERRSRSAEAYRVVRGAVLFARSAVGPAADDDGGALVVMVTSPSPGEGKTTTVANLATVLAEGGLSVLVVNCDFRRPRVHRYLLDAGTGRDDSDVLGDVPGLGRVVMSETKVDGVSLVTGLGEDDPDANPLEVVEHQRRIVRIARSRFDVVVLDTAPFLATNDASELLSETDQVLLVIRAGRTRVEAAQHTAEVLDRFSAPVLGVVMNASDDSPPAQYYYGYTDDDRSRRAEPQERPAVEEPQVSRSS